MKDLNNFMNLIGLLIITKDQESDFEGENQKDQALNGAGSLINGLSLSCAEITLTLPAGPTESSG